MKILVLALLFLSSSAYSESMTKSCNGTIQYCDEYGFCTDEHFYLYAYQYVQFYNGQLRSHRNRFKFRGFILGEEDDYSFSGQFTQDHLIYNGPNLDVAIPWNVQRSTYMIDHTTGAWSVLCR